MTARPLATLADPARSGVYRATEADADAILESGRASALRVARVVLASGDDKAALLARIATALGFPAWFGANWDALEDCLTDLSWSGADGHLLLFEGAAWLPADERAVLGDVLAAAAAFWRERGHAFVAVFIGGEATLPPLRP